MYRPVAINIGMRYTRAKRRNHFISFIAFTSMFGIALGVMVLITVLSVMNGFDYQIRHRFFSMAPQVTVSSLTGRIPDWNNTMGEVLKTKGVLAAAPFVGGQGLLTHSGLVVPVIASGILPDYENKVTDIKAKMVAGKLSDLKPGSFNVILGQQLADNLAAVVGDKINLMIPKASVTPVGMIPRFRRFKVVGIFSAGTGFNFDSRLAFINLQDAQALFELGKTVTGLRLKINNIYAAPSISSTLMQKLQGSYQVTNWTQEFGAFFKAIKMEKTMMFLILILIIAVAAFNLVSSLVMVVNDKQADIAILRTFGAMPRTILAIFMVQGTFVGFIGTFIGVVGGIILSLNATDIVNWLQNVFHYQFLSSNVYFVDYLPSRLQWMDVVHVSLIALLLSFFATIYPAWRASRVQPAEALRYE